MPAIIDVDKDVVTVKADFGNADGFLKLNGNTSIYITDLKKDPASNIRSGTYQITLILDDKKI